MKLRCQLCPKGCVIGPGESGDCRVRVNLDGKLRSVTYGFPTAVHVDPIEKKPLFHFHPGTGIFSIATVGCNLHCRNCQNWEISQQDPAASKARKLLPKDLPTVAQRYDCTAVAYTYTEPLVYYEYTLDCCQAAKAAGLDNVLVTAGYINRKPLQQLCRVVDAANIDLKAYSDKFYRDICDATLKPVLNTLVTTKAAGVLVEVTHLIIPTLNDRDDELRALCRWIKENLGADTPLHFSRFYPQYQLRNLPPTPKKTLVRAREIARAEGLKFVYIGNILVENAGSTFCPKCGKLLVDRQGYRIRRNLLQETSQCPDCKTEIYGRWQ